MSRTLEHWEALLKETFMLIEGLRAELSMLLPPRRLRVLWRRREAQPVAARNGVGPSSAAAAAVTRTSQDSEYGMRMAERDIIAKLLSRSPSKSLVER